MAGRIRAQVIYNAAKLRALEALASIPDHWWTVEDWARKAAITPTRRMYTYALRLARYDLVMRGICDGRIVYRIAPIGIKRLAWIKANR